MRIQVFSLWFLLVVTSWPIQSADRTAKGAAIGAGVGLVAGKDVRDVAKGGLIGGGAGDSDLVWNAVLGIDYRFSNRVAGLLGYRWLDYDYDNGKSGADRFGYDVTYEGPAAAVVFNW